MAGKFELFRLSLIPKPQIDAFEKEQTREDYIRSVFGERHQFEHYGSLFHYIPVEDRDDKQEVLGRIGRQITVAENLPPEENLLDSMREGWKASVIAIDPTEHGDGQKLAFEYDSKVGKPESIIQDFVKYINEKNTEAIYHIEIKPIFDAETFWSWAKKNEGNVTSLTFDFVAPNMFGSTDEISKEMKDFKEAEKAQRISIKLQSDDGLDTSTDKIKNAVEYTTRGGGSISAKAKRGNPYNSAAKVKSSKIDVEEDEHFLVTVAKKIVQVLDRE